MSDEQYKQLLWEIDKIKIFMICYFILLAFGIGSLRH